MERCWEGSQFLSLRKPIHTPSAHPTATRPRPSEVARADRLGLAKSKGVENSQKGTEQVTFPVNVTSFDQPGVELPMMDGTTKVFSLRFLVSKTYEEHISQRYTAFNVLAVPCWIPGRSIEVRWPPQAFASIRHGRRSSQRTGGTSRRLCRHDGCCTGIPSYCLLAHQWLWNWCRSPVHWRSRSLLQLHDPFSLVRTGQPNAVVAFR